MPFIGNQPALSYTSFAKQDFTTSATTSYTLDNPVANANELALFINFVRQEPTTAYSASGTTLTLTEATSSSDDMYCVYLGKAVQTVNPPNASVGESQLVDASITSGKLASGVLPTNTPAFLTNLASNQSINTGVNVKLLFTNEVLDTNNAFASNKFTVPSGEAGSYYVFCCCAWDSNSNGQRLVEIYKNGSLAMRVFSDQGESSGQASASSGGIMVLSVGDYIEAYVQQDSGVTLNIRSNVERTFFGGYKLIGV